MFYYETELNFISPPEPWACLVFPLVEPACTGWRTNCVHHFPTPCSISSPWYLEICHNGSIYTMETDKGCKIRAFHQHTIAPLHPNFFQKISRKMYCMSRSLQTEGVMEKVTLSWPRYNNSCTWVYFLVSLSYFPSERGFFLLKALTHSSFKDSDCPHPVTQITESARSARRRTNESLKIELSS